MYIRKLTVLVLCVLAPLSAAGQDTGHKAQVTKLVKPAIEQQKLVGLAIGLIDASGKQQVYGFGKLDRDKPGVPDGNSVYEIGSISKVFTGILLAEMVLRKQLSLDDPVQSLLPERVTLPRSGEQVVTLRDLATHHSGLARMPSNFSPKEPNNPFADYTVGQMYQFLGSTKLLSKPGSEFLYSNLATGLLGHVLAHKAKLSYEQLLIQTICKPLAMKDTRITLSDDQRARLATPYDREGRKAHNWDIPTLAGAGAIRSTVNDMLKFLAANIGLTQSKLAAAMALSHKPIRNAGRQGKIGLNWMLSEKQQAIWHNGQTGGYHCIAAFDPKAKVGVVVLANYGSGLPDRIAFRLLKMLRGEAYKPLRFRKAIPARKEIRVEPKILPDYVGVYQLQPKFLLTVSLEGGKLMVQATGQSKNPVFAFARDQFFFRVVKAEVVFVRDKEGQVVSMVLHQGGRKMPCKKVK